MKLYQSIALLGLAVFGLASCSEEPDFRAYDPAAETTEEQVTFAQAELSYRLVPTDEIPSQIPVLVRRANAADSVKVKLNATSSDASIINCTADSVEFEAGSLVDTLWVDFDADNYVIGTEYTLGLKLAVDSGVSAVSAAGLDSTSVSLYVDYTWVSAGSCQFSLVKPVQTEAVTVNILAAKESNGTIYRLVSPFANLVSEGFTFDNNENLLFELDEDYNLVAFEPFDHVVATDDEDGTEYRFYHNPEDPDYGQYCSVSNSGNVFTCNSVAYYGSKAYLGAFTFTWDNGYPGDE